MFCQNCGTKMADTAKFCPECGMTTANAPQNTAPAKQSVSVPSAAPVASAVGAVAAAAAVGTAKSAVSKGKKLTALALVLALALTVFTAYFTYFVETPDEVVERFFECYQKADIKGMMECAEPELGNRVNSVLGLGSSLLDIAGIGIDLGDLIGIAPMFSEHLDLKDYNPDNFEVVAYSGDKLSDFLEQFGHKWVAVGNAIGEEAIVEFDIDNLHGGIITGIDSDASRVRVRVRVINCGKDGWRLPEDMYCEYVRDVR